MTQPLPIHFFTIVLNGMPFIRYHIDVFRRLEVPWKWHIVEGVASLSRDTSWSLRNGGRVPSSFHADGLSNDGTTEYLDELAKEFPNQVRLYRKPRGTFWKGKLEMVQAPIPAIQEHALLWQIDSDELWTAEQILTAHELFTHHPTMRAAYFWCHFFVGPDLVISSRDNYGNNPSVEWLRLWRFYPGCNWLSHEPPILGRRWERIHSWVHRLRRGAHYHRQLLPPTDPTVFSHEETEKAGLVFQHLAYVLPEQIRFKEAYYGYDHAESHWRELQQCGASEMKLKEFFPWVKDETIVSRASARGIKLLHPVPGAS